MAKEEVDLSVKMKFAIWLVGLIFVGGMTYACVTTNTRRISKTEETVKENKTEIDDKLEKHKDANILTEKGQAEKHEQIKEQIHQYEILQQRQLAFTESVAQGLSDAKVERKEDRAEQKKYQEDTSKALIKMMESQIKLEAKLNEWEPEDG